MIRYLIVCKNKQEFKSYIEYNKLDPSVCKFVEGPQDITNNNTKQVIFCGTYFSRSDIQEIIKKTKTIKKQRSAKSRNK